MHLHASRLQSPSQADIKGNDHDNQSPQRLHRHRPRGASQALDAGRPVVALESTIITHGMPYPDNSRMAADVEAIIVAEGAVPATIAIVDGRLKIGLSAAEREALAQVKGAMKLSRADLAFALAEGRTGGTTVAATMLAAHLAGIKVFATGGIGGVHKGAELSFDISADLEELGRTPVIVVSAGAKAILDIEKTLEVLETKGVPVVVHGSDVLAGLLVAGCYVQRSTAEGATAARHVRRRLPRFQAARDAIGVVGGMLIANPIPAASEIPAEIMGGYIREAIARATKNSITGKAVTPYLLGGNARHHQRRTSLKANIALVENNARLAAKIAVAIVCNQVSGAIESSTRRFWARPASEALVATGCVGP